LPGLDVPVFDPDVWPGPVPLLVWQLFASRLVHPARTVTAEGRILWTRDFRRLRKEPAGWLEITLLPGLRALLEQLAPAWDDSAGAGLLGLRGLYAAGSPPRPAAQNESPLRHTRPRCARPPRLCLRVLAHLRTPAAGPAPPRLELDFPFKAPPNPTTIV
jgi:hypothetical protein